MGTTMESFEPYATLHAQAPTTEAPTTEAPTTEAPTTEALTTVVPTTVAPTLEAPTTELPTTEAPTTDAPTTEAPTTEAPTTEAPTTEALTTEVPTMVAPTSISGMFMWHVFNDITCIAWISGFNHASWSIMAAHLLHMLLLGKGSSLKGSTSTGLLSTSEDTTSIGESPESDSFPWNVDVAPILPSIIDPKFKCEVPGTHRRLVLSRSGPDNVSNTRWLEEKILAKHLLREAAAAPEVTTLMMCDIPFCLTIDSIIDTINSHGFIDTFNLVYMPSCDRKYLQNLGYVFVNFKTAEYAMSFREAFQGFRWPKTLSEKMSYTKPALCQGYAENVGALRP